MPATIRAFRFRNKFEVVTSGGENCGLLGKEWSMRSELKSKREAYIPASINQQTKPGARQFILDRVHCTHQQAMDLLGMMQDGLEFTRSWSSGNWNRTSKNQPESK
jgi:hypothetical protein